MSHVNADAWYAPPDVEVRASADGSMVVRSPHPLGPFPRCLSQHLIAWASAAPDRVFLGERRKGAWHTVTYASALAAVRGLGAALLAQGLSAERPVAILSENSVNHALLTLAAMHVGIPVAPISPAYSLVSKDHERLGAILDLLKPGLIFIADPNRFATALGRTNRSGAIVAGDADIELMMRSPPSPEVERAFAAIDGETIAKILFTSGSTGAPKGVINTQRMLCANQQSIAQVWPFLERRPPVIVDWLPWNHTFGGNHNFNMVLRNGGSYYIDAGKPLPGQIEQSIANLRDISPTLYFNVPRGFDMFIPRLEQDEALCRSFFRDIDLVFYAAAALPQNLWDRLQAAAVRTRGQKVRMASGWGATETAPGITMVHWPIERAGIIGLPMPGCELKMIPNLGKYELRVRGPGVTPGYLQRPDLTKAAFDDQGFYRMGDAGRFHDPADPSKGLEFDGRVAEDFKLMSGIWVHVGALRVRALNELAPLAQDIVIAGHDREEVGFLIFANPAACRELCADRTATEPLDRVLADPRIIARVQHGLDALAKSGGGSSMHASRALLMAEPPDLDAGEITDKGYINQRAVLARRAYLIERLYNGAPEVIHLSRTTGA